jgi:plastocyanin
MQNINRIFFIGVLFCSLCTVLLAACSIQQASANTGPAVHMGATDFIQHTVTIQKGDRLNLIDDSSSEHIITNGSWINGIQKAKHEARAPSVNHTYTGNDSTAIGPFTTAGTYHLYCTIHVNMNLTVRVQ